MPATSASSYLPNRPLSGAAPIFDCPPGQLIATRAQDVTVRRAAGQAGNVVDLATTMRPKRARITGE